VFSSSVRQPIFKVACQFTHVGCVAESLQFVSCGFGVDAQALADLVLPLGHSRELLFREHANLELVGLIIVIPRLALRWLRHVRLSAELCTKLCEFLVNATTKLARCTGNRITGYQQSGCFRVGFCVCFRLTEVFIY